MVLWKWIVTLVPTLSGFAFGLQALTATSQESPPPSSNLVSSEPQKLTEEELRELEKQRIKQEAEWAFEKLNDYTFKIFSSCDNGTGWILDYQIPEKGKYPTTWYIATNAHVIKKWVFDSNPYSQSLPVSNKKQLKKIKKFPEWVSRYPLNTTASCYFTKKYGMFDLNLSKQSDGENLRSNWGAISQNKMKSPKLFWVAVDLFNRDSKWELKKNNYKDFAVVEIEFTDEKSAREITRNFADKYTVNSNNAINIFNDPLDIETIGDNDKNFYSLGYPGRKDNIFSYTKNLNEVSLVADRLSEDPKNWYPTNGTKLKGHISAKRFSKLKFNWGEEEINRMGHFYLVEGLALGKGSSGSMSIDGNGNLLGVKSIGEKGPTARHSMFIPLRSNEMIVEGNFKTPKYDLILGAKGQKSSYRSQIEKYKKTTWLSSKVWKS